MDIQYVEDRSRQLLRRVAENGQTAQNASNGLREKARNPFLC